MPAETVEAIRARAPGDDPPIPGLLEGDEEAAAVARVEDLHLDRAVQEALHVLDGASLVELLALLPQIRIDPGAELIAGLAVYLLSSG